MDGSTSECGYRYLICSVEGSFDPGTKLAFKTPSGLKYFMQNYGLTIDKATVIENDMRSIGRGRTVQFYFKPRKVVCQFFWKLAEIPDGAKPFVALVNGNYVTNYAFDNGGETLIFKPNPNAADVYIPYDYEVCRKQFG